MQIETVQVSKLKELILQSATTVTHEGKILLSLNKTSPPPFEPCYGCCKAKKKKGAHRPVQCSPSLYRNPKHPYIADIVFFPPPVHQ